LEDVVKNCWRDIPSWRLDEIKERITALRQLLEAEPVQEPVAWVHKQGNHEEPSFRQLDDWEIQNGWEQYPLYTTLPAQPAARGGLTDEERMKLYAKMREKNGDAA
jgi:hypothetical protein